MPRSGIRVSLNDHVHEMVGDERTVCGLVVPFGTDWSTEPVDCPTEVKAEAKAERAAIEAEEPKKAKVGAKA